MVSNPVKARGQVSLVKLYDGTNGKDGKDGAQGVPGAPGADGKTTYVHVAYADSADGKTNFSTTDPTDRKYIGVLTDFSINDSTDYKLYTWSLAQGPVGPTGSTGATGPKGEDGLTTYVHVAYANSADGKTNFSTTDPVGKSYIGVLTDTTPADSTDYTKYTWSLVKGSDGAQGPQGVQGPKGTDGKTTYVHFAYANSADGSKDFSTTDTTGRKYIGVFTDTNINDSTNYTDYTWSLVQGPTGPTGNTGAVGPKGADGRTTYVHVAYADSVDGLSNFSTTDPTGRKYIGVLTDFSMNDSTTPGDYTWSLAQGPAGPTGSTGATGAKGADGRTTYVHVAYANSADGANSFSTTDTTNRAYIGVLTDFNINDSTNYADYTWSLAKGADGAQGPQGVQGIAGAKGADGKTTYVHVAYANSANGSVNFSTTDPTNRAYIGVLTDFNINDSVNYSDYTWSLAKGADGANGAQGVQGPKGADGRTTYVHFAYANSADGKGGFSVSDPVGKAYMGTYTDFTLNDSTNYLDYTWSLVKGSDGANGAQGIQGPKGADGRTTYVHFAYANSADGTTNFSVSDPTGRAYIGTYTDFTINDSTTPSAYTWSLIKGADGANGAQGIQGPKGVDGKNTYVHFAYAGNSTGTTNFSTTDPTGRAYIGVLTDFNINDSTTPSDYTWSLAQGPTGPTGANGAAGPKGADGLTTYVHIVYASNATGTSNFSTTDPTGRTYIGVLTDTTLPDSTNPADYSWSLIKGADGAQGPQGPQGIQGPVGANGKNTYVHFAYANSANGATNFSTTDPTGRAYIGVLTDFNLNDSTNYADYTWSLAKGADGAQGIQGPVGPDGRTSYVHFAYATSADGSIGFSTTDPTGASYIGTYTDFTINDSTNYKSYTWSRMKGDTGNGIANTVIEYQITNTQDQPSDTSGWTTTIPNIDAGVYLWTRTTFVYTDGTKSRTYTVSRQSDNVYTAVLTNDSITLPADASGNVTDFSGSNGQFLVYDGAYQVDPTKVTIQVAQQVNVTVATGGSNYSITAMDKTKDSGYFDLSYTYKGVLLTKRVSVSKSKRGTDGSNPVIVNLSATSQVFTFDSNNKPYPVNQNINFSTTISGTSATPVYTAIPYTDTGTAGTAIVLGAYGTNGKQLQVAQIGNYQRVVVTVTAGGGTDSTTIVRVKDGSSVSPIPDPSNTVSSATPPTNPKEGDWWNDTSQTPNVLKYRYRDKWVQYELDGYYVKANSISGEAIVTNTLEAQKIKYTNSDGTTTNLQTFDLKGIQTAMTDSSGHTYTSMDNAVSSTQTWKSTNNKLDNLQVGGRNLLLNTKELWTGGIGNNGNKVTLTLEAFDSTTNMWHLVAPQQAYNNAGIYFYNGAIQPGDNWALSFDVKGTGNWSSNGARIENSTVTKSVEPLTTSWARVSSTGKKVSAGGAVIFYFDLTNSPLDVYIKLPKLEQGTFATTYTEAPEDVATWTQAQIKATADQINIGVSSAKSTADAATNKVNSLSVGGTNLLLGTKGFTDPLGTNPWTAVVGGYKFTTDGPSGLISHNNAGAWGGPKYSILDLENRGLINTTDTYTISAWVRNTNTSAPITINAYGDAVTWVTSNQVATLRSGDGWVRVSAQLKFQKSTGNTGRLRFEPTTGVPGGIGYIQQAGLKLEKGTLPTSWSPAPEDVPQVNQAYNTDLGSNTAGWDVSPYMNLDTSTGIVTYNRNDLTGTSTSWQNMRQIDSLVMPVKAGDPVSASIFVVSSSATGSLPTSTMTYMTVEFTKLDGSVQQNFTKDISNLTNTRVLNSNIIAPTGAVSARLKIETNGNTSFSFKQPMLVKSYTVGDYTPGFPYSGIQGGRNYVLSSSGVNAMDSSRPVLSGSWTEARTGIASYQPDGITLTNPTTNKTVEWFYQVAGAMTPITNIPLNPGQTFTFSADVMGTVPQAVIRWGFQGTGGSESFQAFKIINPTTWQRISVTLTIPTGATGMYLRIQGGINGQYATGWAGGETLRFRNVKVEDGSVATAWSPAPEDVDGAIKKVSNDLKLTVDGYSLGTTVDGKLVSGFTGNQQQVTIKGNMINLDANTVVGNNFILQSANIGDLTAGKIKTGSIVGNNLNINLDTGAVLFQKGRIYSQGKEIDINIDQNYIRSSGKLGSISIEDGSIYLSGAVYDKPIIADGPSIDLYLYITSVLNPGLDGQPDGYVGAAVLAKDFIKIGLSDFGIAEWIPGWTSNNLGTIISRQTGTSIYGKDIGVNIAGGSVLKHPTGISFKTPRIAVGFNPTKDPTSMSTNAGDDLRSGGILLSSDSVVLADSDGTHGSITRDGIKTNNYTRYVTAQNDTQNLPLVMGLERIGNIVMVSFNFVTYGSTIRADGLQMNGPKIPVGFRPVDNVHIQAHANNSGTTLGTITFTITPEGKVLQTSPAINGGARVMGSGFYLTYSVSPSVGTKMNGSTGNTTP